MAVWRDDFLSCYFFMHTLDSLPFTAASMQVVYYGLSFSSLLIMNDIISTTTPPAQQQTPPSTANLLPVNEKCKFPFVFRCIEALCLHFFCSRSLYECTFFSISTAHHRHSFESNYSRISIYIITLSVLLHFCLLPTRTGSLYEIQWQGKMPKGGHTRVAVR